MKSSETFLSFKQYAFKFSLSVWASAVMYLHWKLSIYSVPERITWTGTSYVSGQYDDWQDITYQSNGWNSGKQNSLNNIVKKRLVECHSAKYTNVFKQQDLKKNYHIFIPNKRKSWKLFHQIIWSKKDIFPFLLLPNWTWLLHTRSQRRKCFCNSRNAKTAGIMYIA